MFPTSPFPFPLPPRLFPKPLTGACSDVKIFIKTKIPFEPPGGGRGGEEVSALVKAKRALGTVPTAHTCDNVLELPNYWALLLRAEGSLDDDGLGKGDVSQAMPCRYIKPLALYTTGRYYY